MIVVETVGEKMTVETQEKSSKAEDKRRILGETGEGVGEDLGVLVNVPVHQAMPKTPTTPMRPERNTEPEAQLPRTGRGRR